MRKKAQAKRKQAQENTDDAAQIKKMMSGVRLVALFTDFLFIIFAELSIYRLRNHDSLEQFQN